jgi:transcriptional regulator GlxA family with amidase domain
MDMGTRLEKIDWEGLAVKCRGNVDSMAATILISRKTVERHFHDKWKMSPARWAKKRLLEKAMLLIQQGYSNKAIASDLKMCNESWLCREFRKAYGAPPQAFRPLPEFPRPEAAS